MPCDTLAEFLDLATYRKSFNGDLMMAKSRPQKFYYFESFPFETTKGPLLVLGKIDKSLLDELKKLGKTIKAKGLCSFKDNVVALTVTDGKLAEEQLKKALALANVRRESTVGDGDAPAPENKGKGEALGLPSEKFTSVRADLQKLLDKAKEIAWKDSDIKRGKEADDKVLQVQRYLIEVDGAIAASHAATKLLENQLRAQARDPKAKLFKPEFDATAKLLARQAALVKDAEKAMDGIRRQLVATRLLAKELTLSGRVFDMRLRSATIKYSIHGDKTRTVHNEKDLMTALGAEIARHLAKPTASKFLNAELENEAVARAVAIAQRDCVWTEVQADGRWAPLNSLVVFVGKPAAGQGWSFVSPPTAGADARKAIEDVIEDFREGKANTKVLLDGVDAAIETLAKAMKGIKAEAPMIASARITLARQGGRWASVSHYPDRTAVPPGWNLRGKQVRLKADSPVVVAQAPRGG